MRIFCVFFLITNILKCRRFSSLRLMLFHITITRTTNATLFGMLCVSKSGTESSLSMYLWDFRVFPDTKKNAQKSTSRTWKGGKEIVLLIAEMCVRGEYLLLEDEQKISEFHYKYLFITFSSPINIQRFSWDLLL